MTDLAVDRAGNVDVTGYTNSPLNIATSGAFKTTFTGSSWPGYNGFIARFGPDGSIRWATYYGDTGNDYLNAIACDSSLGVVVAGTTYSGKGMTTSGSFEPAFTGFEDAILASFDSAGLWRWATYYTGTNGPWMQFEQTFGWGVAVDSASNIILIGQTGYTHGIATPGAYKDTFGYQMEVFIAKFSSQGSRLWCTYFAGDPSPPGGNSFGGMVCTDASNNIYVSATTTSTSPIIAFDIASVADLFR